jgi:4'-phosphopantetheinyl transferase
MFLGLFNKSPRNLHLRPNEIHVWWAALTHYDDRLSRKFYRILSLEEKKRAACFRFRKDRESFIIRRGTLRHILGSYLSLKPNQLHFSCGKHGKLELANTVSQGGIHFNVSHTQGCALYAFSINREVGVDIEYVRDIPEMKQIVQQFFSKSENAFFHTISASQRKEAFFSCWTRKEALIKAIGVGFHYSFDKLTVSMVSSEPTKLVEIRALEEERTQWSIQNLELTNRYKAAIAYKGQNCNLFNFGWWLPYPLTYLPHFRLERDNDSEKLSNV